MDQDKIFHRLLRIKKTALAKYSQFHVASILETVDGELFTGHNIEFSSYGLTICAERVALFKALSEGRRQFSRIYILSDAKAPCPPCGMCRQALMDYAPGLEVVMYGSGAEVKRMSIADLLPYAFTPDMLPGDS